MKDLHLLDAFRIDTRETHGWNGDGTCDSFRGVPEYFMLVGVVDL